MYIEESQQQQNSIQENSVNDDSGLIITTLSMIRSGQFYEIVLGHWDGKKFFNEKRSNY